jgi:[ribosomal protein S18]-alanine N-acetyltransferase
MNLTKIHTGLPGCLLILKRMPLNTAISFFLRRWEQTEKENIVSVEGSMISEILRIQAEGFKNGSPEKLVKYSKNYKNIFYVIKSQDKL